MLQELQDEITLDLFEDVENCLYYEGDSERWKVSVRFPEGYSRYSCGYRFVRDEEWEAKLIVMDGLRRIGCVIYHCMGQNLRDGDPFYVWISFYRNGACAAESPVMFFLHLGFLIPKTGILLTAGGLR